MPVKVHFYKKSNKYKDTMTNDEFTYRWEVYVCLVENPLKNDKICTHKSVEMIFNSNKNRSTHLRLKK